MKLSEKKKTELYKTVSDEIMDARIRIAKILNRHGNLVSMPVDDVLYHLGMTAPQKAIQVFKVEKKK